MAETPINLLTMIDGETGSVEAFIAVEEDGETPRKNLTEAEQWLLSKDENRTNDFLLQVTYGEVKLGKREYFNDVEGYKNAPPAMDDKASYGAWKPIENVTEYTENHHCKVFVRGHWEF